MSSDIVFNARVNTADARGQLRELKGEAEEVNTAIVSQLRRTAQVAVSVAQITGQAIDQTYALAIEAALLSIEFVTVTTAASLSTPTGALLAIGRVVAVASLLTLISQLEQGRTEAAVKTRGVANLFRMLVF